MINIYNITIKILGLLIIANFIYAQHIYWAKRYDALSEEAGGDWSQAITIDANNNVYVTGSSFQFSTSYDYAPLAVYKTTNGGNDWQAIIYGFKILKSKSIANKDLK